MHFLGIVLIVLRIAGVAVRLLVKWVFAPWLTLAGLVTFGEFIFEESIQFDSFAARIYKDRRIVAGVEWKMREMERHTEQSETLNVGLGWLNPFTNDAFRAWNESARDQIRAHRDWALGERAKMGRKVKARK